MAKAIPHIVLVDDGLPATRPNVPDGPTWLDELRARLDAADQSPDDLPPPLVVFEPGSDPRA